VCGTYKAVVNLSGLWIYFLMVLDMGTHFQKTWICILRLRLAQFIKNKYVNLSVFVKFLSILNCMRCSFREDFFNVKKIICQDVPIDLNPDPATQFNADADPQPCYTRPETEFF
jgi:hypothetical protein